MNSKIFRLDTQYYKKQIFWKYLVLSLLNISILGFGIWKSETQEISIYLIVLGVLILMGVLFRRNALRQIELLEKNIYELDGKILKHYSNTPSCMELNLNDLEIIYTDNIFKQNRILLKFSKDRVYTYSHILNMEEFLRSLEQVTNQKAIPLIRNFYELGFKFFFIFLPSMVAYGLSFFPKFLISIPIVFLIFNLNLIFFLFQISEDKLLGGVPRTITRRLILILVVSFSVQFYQIFLSY